MFVDPGRGQKEKLGGGAGRTCSDKIDLKNRLNETCGATSLLPWLKGLADCLHASVSGMQQHFNSLGWEEGLSA